MIHPTLSNELNDIICECLPSKEEKNRILDLVKGADIFPTQTSDLGISNRNEDHGACVPLSPGLSLLYNGQIVKYGKDVSLTEAAAMEFVRRNTEIPVPRVHTAFIHEGCTYIVMDHVVGETLEVAQFTLSDEQLRGIAKELRGYVDMLRKLGSEREVGMGSWPSGPYRNIYFREQSPTSQFDTMEEFRQYWIQRNPDGEKNAPPFPRHDIDGSLPIGGDHVQNGSPPVPQIALTHGDLSSRNILISTKHDHADQYHKNGNEEAHDITYTIAAILDWETLGWYPEFWEYAFASRGAWYNKWIDALEHRDGFGGRVTGEGSYYRYIVNEAIANVYTDTK